MKSQLLTFVTGAAFGALATFLATRPAAPPTANQPDGGASARSIRPDRQGQKIAALEEKIAQLESARSRDGEPEKPEGPETSVRIFGSGGESKIDLAEMQKHIERAESGRREKRVAAELASLSSALGLSGEQVESVRALLERRAAQRAGQLGGILRLAQGALTGDAAGGGAAISALTPEALAGAAAADPEALDFDTELLALLDAGQADAYRDYQESRRENQIEASANSQLAQLQTTVPDLTKQQKDRAFDEFARLAREDAEAHGVPDQGSPSTLDLGRLQAQREAEKQAMQEILSPEQFEVYEANSSRSITIGSHAGATIIASEIIVDPDLDRGGIAPIGEE